MAEDTKAADAAPEGAGARPPISRGKRIAFVAISLLMPLIAAEIAVRILYRPSYLYIDDADGLDFRLAPHAEVGEVRLNDRGFNDVDRAIEKPAGVHRIVALGDSFTFGITAREDTIPALLEARLAAERPEGGAAVEVHNLGISAYGTDQEVEMLRREALPRDPDIVLLFFYVGNDVRDNARRDDRRVVNGKLVRGSRAHWRRRLLRSSALYRFFDDRGGLFGGSATSPLQRGLSDRARARADAQRALIARVAGGDPDKRLAITDEAVAIAREAAVDTEMLADVPKDDWLARERAVVAEAERWVREALDPDVDSPVAAKALGEVFIRLEERAREEARRAILGPAWIGTHLRFAPVYQPGREDEIHLTGWSETERLLGEAARMCAEAGAELRIVILPSEIQVDERARRTFLAMAKDDPDLPPDFDFEAPQRRIEQIAAKNGTPVLDVLEACRAADRETRLYQLSNNHFNEAGNRVVAERVAEWLGPVIPR